jgi:hypothetical protein
MYACTCMFMTYTHAYTYIHSCIHTYTGHTSSSTTPFAARRPPTPPFDPPPPLAWDCEKDTSSSPPEECAMTFFEAAGDTAGFEAPARPRCPSSVPSPPFPPFLLTCLPAPRKRSSGTVRIAMLPRPRQPSKSALAHWISALQQHVATNRHTVARRELAPIGPAFTVSRTSAGRPRPSMTATHVASSSSLAGIPRESRRRASPRARGSRIRASPL